MIYFSTALVILGSYAYLAFNKWIDLKKPTQIEVNAELKEQLELMRNKINNLELSIGMTRNR
jgi:hypothetical protein